MTNNIYIYIYIHIYIYIYFFFGGGGVIIRLLSNVPQNPILITVLRPLNSNSKPQTLNPKTLNPILALMVSSRSQSRPRYRTASESAPSSVSAFYLGKNGKL